MHSIICAVMCSPVSGRNSWLQAGAPSFHGWAPGRCNTPACFPQQPPTPDGTPSLGHRYKEGTERNNMGNAHSKIQHRNWKCSLIIMQLCANSFWGGKDVLPTSQLTTTQLGDLHVVEGALHCSGAPGPVVTSYRSESGPNCAHQRTQTIEYNWRMIKLESLVWRRAVEKNKPFIFYWWINSKTFFSPQPCSPLWAGSCRFCQALNLPQSSPARGPGKPPCSPQAAAHSFLYCSTTPGFPRLSEGGLENTCIQH